MKLVADPEIAAWLATGPTMQWHVGNSSKSAAKLGFHAAEVESLFGGAVLFAGHIVEPEHEEARYLLLAATSDGRRAALIFARRVERLRPISRRTMRKKEKEAYDEAT